MPFKALQKIVKNGTSWQITLPRPLLFELQLYPGDPILVWTTEDGIAHFKPFRAEIPIAGMSPGIIPDNPNKVRP